MKDLYKRLSIEPTASEAEIRRALPLADEPTRTAVQLILLVPRRRTVYDRNHRVLTTIGQLRGRLALGLRPFWSHGHHQDFAQPFVAPRGSDPISVINPGGRTERHRHKSIRGIWFLWFLLLIAFLIAILWLWIHRR